MHTRYYQIARNRKMQSIDMIAPIVRELPPELQKEVIDYVLRLAHRTKVGEKRHLNLDWAGGLAYLAETTTSVNLQHDISKWRI
jgi:hypothetical protein